MVMGSLLELAGLHPESESQSGFRFECDGLKLNRGDIGFAQEKIMVWHEEP